MATGIKVIISSNPKKLKTSYIKAAAEYAFKSYTTTGIPKDYQLEQAIEVFGVLFDKGLRHGLLIVSQKEFDALVASGRLVVK